MRTWMFFTVALLLSCEGRLSDEQRKRIKEEMQLQKIKKVSEVEITEAAFAEGRKLVDLANSFGGDSVRIDSLMQSTKGKMRFVVPGKSNVMALEQQLIDAYLEDESGMMLDNVQRARPGKNVSDSLLYTKPVIEKMPDGSEKLIGIWNIWLSQKQLIIAMDK
jgi:hypothetical protein